MWLIKQTNYTNIFGHFLAWIPDSRHVRQSQYTVLHEESYFQVKNSKFKRLGSKQLERINLVKRTHSCLNPSFFTFPVSETKRRDYVLSSSQASECSKSEINLRWVLFDTYRLAFLPLRTVVLVDDGQDGVWALSFIVIVFGFAIRPMDGSDIFSFIGLLLS